MYKYRRMVEGNVSHTARIKHTISVEMVTKWFERGGGKYASRSRPAGVVRGKLNTSGWSRFGSGFYSNVQTRICMEIYATWRRNKALGCGAASPLRLSANFDGHLCSFPRSRVNNWNTRAPFDGTRPCFSKLPRWNAIGLFHNFSIQDIISCTIHVS